MMGVVLVVEEISCVEEEKKEKVETKEKGTGEELMKEN